ncbi:MAG: YfbM family protein [Candidatus Blackburnbacteria bacterium]|nr:YfbM family protein [Candidatus Blackburnbacteria bacterium]
MSMIQHYKQVTQNKILEIDKNTSIIPKILQDNESYPQLNIDKSWDGIHFLLTGKATGDKVDQSNPLEWVIAGWGEQGPEVGYGPSRVVAPKEVTQLAHILSKLKDDDFKKRFDPVKMNDVGIYPDGIWDEENILDWLVDNFHQVKDFYIDAAKKGNAVLIWTD